MRLQKKKFKKLVDDILNTSDQFKHYKLNYNGHKYQLEIISEQKLPIELEQRLEPYHTLEKIEKQTLVAPKLVIIQKAVVEKYALPLPREGLRKIEMHSCEPGVISTNWLNDDFPKYAKTTKGDVEFILYSKDLVFIIGDLKAKLFRREVIKTIRALFEITLLKSGWLKVQFGSLVKGKNGIAFSGPKGAGKTSFIARLLSSKADYSYGSNDKCYIGYHQGSIKALGTPQLIGLRPGTLSCYKNILDYADHPCGEKTYFSPALFTQYFNRVIQTNWEIKKIFIPAIDLKANKVVINKIDIKSAEKILHEEVFHFSDASLPHWLITELFPEASALKSNLQQQLIKPLLNLLWFSLAGNPLYCPHLKL